ncbi:MAG: Various polyols ABC transporter, permease protein 1, partial [uncultured Thermomicrobiales bacterium]
GRRQSVARPGLRGGRTAVVHAPAPAPADRAVADPAGADLRHRRHAGPVHPDPLLQLPALEPAAPVDPRLRRLRQLPVPAHGGPGFPGGPPQHRDLHDLGGTALAARRAVLRRAGQPPLSRPRHRAHAADHALPHHARRRVADVEEHDAQPHLRGGRLGDADGAARRLLAELAGRLPERVDHPGAGLALGAVHDADPARGDAVDLRRGAGSGAGRRRHRLAGVPQHHAAAPVALHAARRPARHRLHRPGLRPDLPDDQGWPGDRHHQPLLPDLPQGGRSEQRRPGGRARGDRRDPVDDRDHAPDPLARPDDAERL